MSLLPGYYCLQISSPSLVRDAELLWVLETVEPARTREVTSKLPLNQNSVYVRLRSLSRRGYVDSELLDHVRSKPYGWEVTDSGQETIAEADLPPAAETDFDEFFSERSRTMTTTMLLEELAAHGEDQTGGWVPSSAIYSGLPFSKYGIRKKLHALTEDGLVELDDERQGQEYYWRVTKQGRKRLDGDNNNHKTA